MPLELWVGIVEVSTVSRLEQLINKLCPNGVEYKIIKDAFQRLKGTPITASKMKEIESANGEIRIFAGGKTVINAKEKDIPNANIIRVPAVLVQSRGVIDVIYFESPFTFKNEMWAYTTEEKTTVKYLYYVLKNNIQLFRDSASGMGSLPQISLPVTEEFKIPLPPLPVQEEIVRILDNFTELTMELTMELTAELAARKQQYEYYRNGLLSKETKKKTLKEISLSSRSGGTPLKNNKEYYENGTIPWLRTQEVVFNEIYETDCLITELAVQETSAKWVPANCVIVAISGASAGRCAINKIPLTTNQHCLCIEIDPTIALYRYVFHCISNQYQDLFAKKEGARGDLNAARILSLEVPIPSIPKQERIVEILDRFDTFCNDITEGLPAEIKARQQQYEYYRDKLLTFKEKEVCVNEQF
jgi:type I restriction enzyme S subunit